MLHVGEDTPAKRPRLDLSSPSMASVSTRKSFTLSPRMSPRLDLSTVARGVGPTLISPRGDRVVSATQEMKDEENIIWESSRRRQNMRDKLTDVLEEREDHRNIDLQVRRLMSQPITVHTIDKLNALDIGREVLKDTDIGKVLKDYATVKGASALIDKWRTQVKNNIHLAFEIEKKVFDKYSHVPNRSSTHGPTDSPSLGPQGSPSLGPQVVLTGSPRVINLNQPANGSRLPQTPNSYGNMVTSQLLSKEQNFTLHGPHLTTPRMESTPTASNKRDVPGSPLKRANSNDDRPYPDRSPSQSHPDEKCISKEGNSLWKYSTDCRTIINLLKREWNKQVKDDIISGYLKVTDFMDTFWRNPEEYNSPQFKKRKEDAEIEAEKQLAVSSEYPFFDAAMTCPRCRDNSKDSSKDTSKSDASKTRRDFPVSDKSNYLRGCRYNVTFYDMWDSYRGSNEGQSRRRVACQCCKCGYEWSKED